MEIDDEMIDRALEAWMPGRKDMLNESGMESQRAAMIRSLTAAINPPTVLYVRTAKKSWYSPSHPEHRPATLDEVERGRKAFGRGCVVCGCDYVCGPGACCPLHKCVHSYHGGKS